tara:strand:+ start:2983 stop:3177 length:195 start_codon:yes stop_codon:yes gene_type:complete
MLTFCDKYKIVKISNENFNNFNNFYINKNKYNFEKYKTINNNKLKPIHKGCWKIIQPGGGYKEN